MIKNKHEAMIWNRLKNLFHIKFTSKISVGIFNLFVEKFDSFIQYEPPFIDDKVQTKRLDFFIYNKDAGISDIIEVKSLNVKSTLSHIHEYYIRQDYGNSRLVLILIGSGYFEYATWLKKHVKMNDLNVKVLYTEKHIDKYVKSIEKKLKKI